MLAFLHIDIAMLLALLLKYVPTVAWFLATEENISQLQSWL